VGKNTPGDRNEGKIERGTALRAATERREEPGVKSKHRSVVQKTGKRKIAAVKWLARRQEGKFHRRDYN